ncbi:MAG: 30S ribosomal protein S1 [Armatimonadetes bacterium RBG_16_58_9]|nr:MAG: 30S ribosomal protein S1 [Armatimonadetes bacterium RBG_16_58_9]
MSDEKNEQERSAAHAHHEMSETPFGAASSDSGYKPETPEITSDVEPEKPVDLPQIEASAEEPAEDVETPPAAEEEEPMSMEDAMQMAEAGGQGVDYSGTFRSLREHDVVDGVVVHMDHEGVLVDVGTKSEGSIKPSELSRDPNVNPEDVVAVGDRIKVYVVKADSQDGGPILSKKRADFENAWERVEKANGTGEVLKAMVTDRVKGGLVVDLGIRGFVPASHVGGGKLKNLEKFVGQSMPFKVIEVDRERRKVVLSNRLAVQAEREVQRKDTLTTLAEGQIREGVVRRITDYGAFVDLGGVDGLLHISEMSWTRIKHPSECVRPGQKVQVMVLKLNLNQGRVSLGLRQILPDPWEEIRRIHSVGTNVMGTVTRLVPFGAFVQVEGGVEGIVPNSELAVRRINKPEDVVSVGQEVEVKVIDLRPDERRLTLSIRQLQAQKEREREDDDYRNYSQIRGDGGTTIGDLIGDQLGDFASAMVETGKPARRKSRAKSAKKEAIEEAEAFEEAEVLAEAEEMIEAASAIEEVIEKTFETEGVVEETSAVVAEPEAVAPVVAAKKSKKEAAEKPKAKKTTIKRAAKPKAKAAKDKESAQAQPEAQAEAVTQAQEQTGSEQQDKPQEAEKAEAQQE